MATNAAKLGVGAGGSLLVRGLDAAAAAEVLGDLPAGVHPAADGAGAADVVLLFASGADQVDAELEAAHGLVADGGRLWVAYRKGAGPAGLNRDSLQRTLAPHGLVGVTLVSLDATWSAMRVRELRPGEASPAS